MLHGTKLSYIVRKTQKKHVLHLKSPLKWHILGINCLLNNTREIFQKKLYMCIGISPFKYTIYNPFSIILISFKIILQSADAKHYFNRKLHQVHSEDNHIQSLVCGIQQRNKVLLHMFILSIGTRMRIVCVSTNKLSSPYLSPCQKFNILPMRM